MIGVFCIEIVEYLSGEMKLVNVLIWEMECYLSYFIVQLICIVLEGMFKVMVILVLEVKEECGIGMVVEGDDGYIYCFGFCWLLDSDVDCEGDIFFLKDKEIMVVFWFGDDFKKGIQLVLVVLGEQGVESYILSGDQQVKMQ